jgi:hypothetical protein
MKTIFKISLAAVVVLLTSFVKFSDEPGMARVQKILGKEVYVLCEPVRAYDVVDQTDTFFSGGSNIYKQVRNAIYVRQDNEERAKKKGKEVKEWDALITTEGSVVLFVKFK